MDTLPFRVASALELGQLAPDALRHVLAGPPGPALRWLGAAAVGGQLDAQMTLGQWFLAGRGVPPDAARAHYWFKRAALCGHAGAANLVGRCYENGWGTPADARAATHWFHTAALRGSDWGMYNFATSLALGRGIAASRAAAFTWFERAAARGHAKSLNVVGGFYEDGWHVARNLACAADHYRRAAAGGDFRGCFNHARMLALGGHETPARAWVRCAAVTAHAPFVEKMLHWLRAAPQPALRALADAVQGAQGAQTHQGAPAVPLSSPGSPP